MGSSDPTSSPLNRREILIGAGLAVLLFLAVFGFWLLVQLTG